ncbi:PREDICTED: uncharacterized protein LOC109187764 [Ipomoea nil]|uniref:uncharacterized protein LOC109187764 n=1 Tax=Ipomoea nil TaxID=35883 RepID=UPI0009017D7A|nr:PREDICTED: uncharacterized protein LOC109187764 [Ipomoea nil]XP_019193620.1 PREDICTED: uncharacterized protein LOC109187764 [Ipomoea nil]
MVQTLEEIKGGGGSIRVGTTGTISALMSRELDSIKPASQTPETSRNKPPSVCAFVVGDATSPKRLKSRTVSSDEASSSARNDETVCKTTKNYHRRTHQIPILEVSSVDGTTPVRQKVEKKGAYMVEIVDIKCGSVEKAWGNPIKNRIKKLGFSKLSDDDSPV